MKLGAVASEWPLEPYGMKCTEIHPVRQLFVASLLAAGCFVCHLIRVKWFYLGAGEESSGTSENICSIEFFGNKLY